MINIYVGDAGAAQCVIVKHRVTESIEKAVARKMNASLSVGRIFWGYNADNCFVSGNVPEAKGFVGSMKAHHLVGLCGDKQQADALGPLWVRDNLCAFESFFRQDLNTVNSRRSAESCA